MNHPWVRPCWCRPTRTRATSSCSARWVGVWAEPCGDVSGAGQHADPPQTRPGLRCVIQPSWTCTNGRCTVSVRAECRHLHLGCIHAIK